MLFHSRGLLMKETLHHYPLTEPRSIRLLTLAPAQEFNAALKCELKETPLDDKPFFEALSYVWGDPTHTGGVIFCLAKPLYIMQNCDAALRRLCHTTPLRVFWIDSICIDQMSLEERNKQVRFMPDIYCSAATVIVWLGEGKTATGICFKWLHRISLLKSFTSLPQVNSLLANKIKKIDGRSIFDQNQGCSEADATL